MDGSCFVLLFQGRCGSSHLIRLLDSHPDVRARGEHFGRIRREGGGGSAQLRWARNTLSLANRPGVEVAGFKTKLRDVLDRDGLRDLMSSMNATVLHLERRNLVKLAVSAINAGRIAKGETGKYNIEAPTQRPGKFELDVARLERHLRQREQEQKDLRAYVASLQQDAHYITYEELLTAERETLQGVFEALGVEPSEVRSDIVKATSDDLREAISNFHEVRVHFVGTQYEWMFDEVLVK